eukprot:1006239-Karenia_brevis.AAC.1
MTEHTEFGQGPSCSNNLFATRTASEVMLNVKRRYHDDHDNDDGDCDGDGDDKDADDAGDA